MPLHWSIDGKRVHLNDDFEATSSAAGGYEQLTATADRDEVKFAHQGARISGVTSAGHECWYGTLDSTPAASRHPIAQITATGPVSKARRQRGTRLYQSTDYSLWGPITSDPHNYTAIGALNVAQSISADAQTGRLLWQVTNGTDIKNNDANGLVAWFSGEAVTRIAFDWSLDAGTSNYALRIYTGTGPKGTLTQRGTDKVSGAGASGSEDITLSAGDDDMVALVWYRSAANATTSSNSWLRIGNLRVNGRTLGDDLSPGQIIADFAQSVGWKTGNDVKSSGQNALPFYWQGGSWGDAIDGLALLDDWPWVVTRDRIAYNPWDVKWDLRFSQEHEDLDFPPIYNSVRVFYTTLAGAPRSVLVQASPDPLARFNQDFEYQYDLNQSYDGDNTPTAVGNALIDRLSKQRVLGTVTVNRIDTNKRVWTPEKHWTIGNSERVYHILPGDLAHLDPYPGLPPQRIVGVRLHARDVEVEFGEDIEQVSAGSTLARITAQRARARHPMGKKKK
jgi:hypothetical protein